MNNKILFIAVLSLFLASCSEHSHETDGHAHDPKNAHASHGHDHGDIKNLYTVYTEDLELFAEAEPLAKGKKSRVLAHFTSLPDFKPMDSAKVTLRLIIDGKELKQERKKARSQGIYSFRIKPEVRGKGQMIFDIDAGTYQRSIVVDKVQVFKNKHNAEHAAEKFMPNETNATAFTKEQSWKIKFETAHPSFEPFGELIKTSAKVISSQDDEAKIIAKSSGIVFFAKGDLVTGSKANKNQALFTIASQGLNENNNTANYKAIKNNYEKAKSDFERLDQLEKDQIVSKKEWLDAKTNYENAKLHFENFQNSFNHKGQNIISTMDGYLTQLMVSNGQFVEEGQMLARVSKNKTLLLKAEVQQKFTSKLSQIKTASIRSLKETFSLEELNGSILSFGRTVNSDNYLLPVNLQVDNNGKLINGSLVEVNLQCESTHKVISIPKSALIEEQGIFFVFVQLTPELFEKREVTLGAQDFIKTEIVSGLLATERIVTQGAVLVKLSQASSALDPHSGHTH